jgi:hypothetical protein
MALQVISRTFTDYQGRPLTFLLANSIDPITATYVIEPYFGFNLSTSNSVVKDVTNWTLTSGSWEGYGFVAGDTITLSNIDGGAYTSTRTISLIDGALMILDSDYPVDNQAYSIGTFSVNKNPEGLDLSFNLVKNSTTGSENSLIDGEATRFTIDGLNLFGINSFASMTQVGLKSGMSKITSVVTRLADVATRQRYSIALTFKVSPWMDSSVFAGSECVKPWLKVKCLPQYNNPSVFLTTTNVQNANTGYKDENFNGLPKNYTLNYLTWKTLANVAMTAFDYSQPSKFEIRVDGVFSASSKLNLKLFFLPINDADYKNNAFTHDQNTILLCKSSPITVGSNADLTSETHSSGANYVVSAINVTNNTTYSIISGTITPNMAFTTLLEDRQANDRNYKFWVRCENPTFDANSTDAVNLEIDSNAAIKTSVPLGAYKPLSDKLLNHNYTSYLNGTTNAVITEDDVLREFTFRWTKNQRFSYISGRIWAYNIITGAKFLLDEQTVNIESVPTISDGSIPVNYSQSRGFKLPETSEILRTTLLRVAGFDTATQFGLKFTFPFLTRWEYWQNQANANADFYASKNKDWQHYSADANWRMQTEVAIKVDAGEYLNPILFDVRTYDDWSGVSVFTYFKADGTPITAPIANEIITVKCTHTPTSMSFGAVEVWGSITVEPKESAPRWLISSKLVHGSQPLNPLQCSTGQTKLKQTVNATNVVHECTFFSDNINIVNGIKFTGRINMIVRDKNSLKDITAGEKILTANNNSIQVTAS